MSQPIRIIHLEDIRSDAEIVKRELTKGGLSFDLIWATSKDAFLKALSEFTPDIIISDHSLPGFSSQEAFHALQRSGLNVPFILVTATISEEFAVSMMREGIADYLLKDRLQRLPGAVTNALEKWQSEREKITSHELLVQNEKRFRGLIENSHDMIGVSDANFRPTFASSSYTRITGRTLKERRAGDLDFIHPDDRSGYYAILNSVIMEPGKYFPVLYRMLHKNGSFIWVEGTVVNMLDDESIRGILFNLRDVTARISAEESLKKSQASITAIIENTNVSIFSIDRQFRYLSFNTFLKKNLNKVYGLNIKVGDHVFDFLEKLDPSQLDDWRRIYTEAFRGNRLQFEKEFVFGDFHAFQSFSINPIIEGDYVTGLSCFVWDITEQKQAALKVAQSEARFRALIENNYDAITLRDRTGKLMYASPSAGRILGIDPGEFAEILNQPPVHPEDVEATRQLYEIILEDPGVPHPVNMRVKHKQGQYLWLEGVMTNMLHNDSVKGIVTNFRDVTERKESELQREKITLDLIERNKNLEQYAYIVSHNLRAPVANILGLSNLLDLPGVSEADRQESLAHLFTSTRRLDEVIKDLNLILQMRHNISDKKEEVTFDNVVNDIKSSIQGLILKRKMDFTTNFQVKSIATVKSYLYSIFYNLITNSIKYKKPEGKLSIYISSEMVGDRLRLSFKDNGLGIDLSAHGSSVFGLYKRFHIGQAEGKGMGLFMTKTQVETLGGRISVKSEVGEGTEFIIEL